MKLTVVNINGMKFKGENGYYMASKATWALKTEKGYLSFDGVYPYSPSGGKKLVTNLSVDGNMGNLEQYKYIQPMEV